MQRKTTNFTWIATILIVVGVLLLGYNYINSEKLKAYEYIDSKLITGNTDLATIMLPDMPPSIEEIEESATDAQTVTDDNVPNYYYIGYLEIPKIEFKRGFVDPTSADNTVEKNIMVITPSSFPDVQNGNFIIAGHSGVGYKAFFNNLEQLSLKDRAYVTYQGVRYTYEIADIYQQEKNGMVSIKRDRNQTTLTLITCTNYVEGSQTVYIAYLVDKQEIN